MPWLQSSIASGLIAISSLSMASLGRPNNIDEDHLLSKACNHIEMVVNHLRRQSCTACDTYQVSPWGMRVKICLEKLSRALSTHFMLDTGATTEYCHYSPSLRAYRPPCCHGLSNMETTLHCICTSMLTCLVTHDASRLQNLSAQGLQVFHAPMLHARVSRRWGLASERVAAHLHSSTKVIQHERLPVAD